MTAQAIDPALSEIRNIQAQNLMQISEMRGQHPAEIDPVLTEEILLGEIKVPDFTPPITVQPNAPNTIPWIWLLTGLVVGVATGVAIAWGSVEVLANIYNVS